MNFHGYARHVLGNDLDPRIFVPAIRFPRPFAAHIRIRSPKNDSCRTCRIVWDWDFYIDFRVLNFAFVQITDREDGFPKKWEKKVT